MTALGVIIKRLRKGKKWTQEELAAKTSIKRTAISDLENGVKTTITPDQKESLAAAFNISIEEFDKLLGGVKLWIVLLLNLLYDE